MFIVLCTNCYSVLYFLIVKRDLSAVIDEIEKHIDQLEIQHEETRQSKDNQGVVLQMFKNNYSLQKHVLVLK